MAAFRKSALPPGARILAAADRLFYAQGIRAVGVDAVAAAAGVSKRTLYNYYPSKDELIAAYLEARFRNVTPGDEPPRAQILGTFDRLERLVKSPGFRGCPFVNAVAEIGEAKHPANAIAVRFKEARRQWFKTLLERMEIDDANALATQMAILVDGAIAAALVRGDPTYVRAARDAAETLLASARSTNIRRS